MSSLSAGVGFLLKPGLAAQSCLFQEVIKGRFASLELVINNLKFIIFNIYAPSEISDRKTFFSVVINHLKLFDINQCICIGGDFNCTFEPKLDRNSPEPHPEAHVDFSHFLSIAGFLDVWCLMQGVYMVLMLQWPCVLSEA